MDAGKLQVEIVTPQGLVYRGEADGVVVPGVEGYLGILPRHAPAIAELGVGEVRLRRDRDWQRYAISSGVVHVRDRVAVIMAEAIEPAESIDVERARRAAERARERLRLRFGGDIDVQRAQFALARALNRLKVSGAGIDR